MEGWDARQGKVERQEQDSDEVLDLLRKRAANLLGHDKSDEERSEDGMAARTLRQLEPEKGGGREKRRTSQSDR